MKISLIYTLPFFVLAAVFCFSCSKEENEFPADISKSVFVYMVADNDLDYYGVENVIDMQKGLSDTSYGHIIVYLDRASTSNPSHPCLYDIKHDTVQSITSKIIRVYPEQNSCDAGVFENVFSDAESYCKMFGSDITRLVFWSHGTGWLPQNALTPIAKSFGQDSDEEMDIISLSEVLNKRHFEYILMDACFMGSLETAFQMRKCADYLILSPSEVLSRGFPYDKIAQYLVEAENCAEEICKSFYDCYSVKQNAFCSATISLEDTKWLDSLAESMNFFYNDLCFSDSIAAKIPQYDRTFSGYFFDFQEFVKLYCKNEKIKDDILKKYNFAVKKYLHTQKMFSVLDLKDTYGLSIYVPNNFASRKKVHEYYKKLDWYEKVSDSFNF